MCKKWVLELIFPDICFGGEFFFPKFSLFWGKKWTKIMGFCQKREEKSGPNVTNVTFLKSSLSVECEKFD